MHKQGLLYKQQMYLKSVFPTYYVVIYPAGPEPDTVLEKFMPQFLTITTSVSYWTAAIQPMCLYKNQINETTVTTTVLTSMGGFPMKKNTDVSSLSSSSVLILLPGTGLQPLTQASG